MQEQQAHRCSVCLQPPAHPAQVKACGHEYCLECLQQWCRTRRQPKCPLCQAEITHIVHGDQEEEVMPPDKVEEGETGPDLACLDHAYFEAESGRLLCRARAAQMQLVRSAYSCGRQGSSAADAAGDALQQAIDTLTGYREDMQQLVPFQPEVVLHELYSLDQVVQSIAAGGWTDGGGGGGLDLGLGGSARGAAQATPRFGADDAAAGLHEWEDGSDGEGQGWDDDDDDDNDDHEGGLDSYTRRRLERASLSSTPGRRPVPAGSQQRRRHSGGGGVGGSGGSMAAANRSRSSGGLATSRSGSSLAAGGGGRRR